MSSTKKRTKKPFDELTITDNYMFQTVMTEPKHVRPLLEMIIGKKIRKIEVLTPEKTVETGYDSRGIRMDVYVEDDENTVYDVEMQASRRRSLGKRFRYYISSIDVDIVNKGDDFGVLKDSFIIFITTYDPFDKGWYMYPFETICSWDNSVKMKDHAKRIILNTKGTKDKEGHEVSVEIKGMLSYMDGNTPDSDYAKMLDDAVKKVKNNQERRNEYMNLNLFAIDERVLGKYSEKVERIRKNNGQLSDDQLIKFMEITPEFLQCVREAIENNPDWDDEDVADYALSETESD